LAGDGLPGDHVKGANVDGFLKLARATHQQVLV
jgi:hypothetical protein